MDALSKAFGWHDTLLTSGGGSTVAVCTGAHDTLFVLLRDAADQLMLRRLTKMGRERSTHPVMTLPANTSSVRLVATSTNDVIVALVTDHELRVVHVDQLGGVRHTSFRGAWSGMSTVAGDNTLFLAAALEGEVELDNKRFHNHSVIFEITGEGDILWSHKLLGKVGGLATGCDGTLYVCGVRDEDNIFVHQMSRIGVSLCEWTFVVPGIDRIEAAAVAPCGELGISGTAVIEDEAEAFHVCFHPATKTLSPVRHVAVAKRHMTDVVVVGARTMLYLQVEDEGSWLLGGNTVVAHHWGDQWVVGRPQLVQSDVVEELPVLFKGGRFLGKLIVDSCTFDVGSAEYTPYYMHFLTTVVSQR